MLVTLAMLWGCGGGGGATPTAVAVASKGTVTITSSGSGKYIVQANDIQNVYGIQLDVKYDGSSPSLPTVVKGGFISGAFMEANPSVAGNIKIAIVSTTPFTGSGPIAEITFPTATAAGNVTISSVQMIDSNGATIQ